MGCSQSTLDPFYRSRANQRRDQTIDATLGVVQTSLQALGSVANLLPVAGVGTAVSILQLIVQQIRSTRMNSKTAADLRDEILELVNSIGDIVGKMNERVKPGIQSLDDEQKSYIHTAQVRKPSLFKEIVDRLIEDLKPLPEDIKKAQSGGLLSRFLRSNDVTLQLDGVKGKILAAKERFQSHQLVLVTKTVEELQALIEDLRAMQAEALSKIDDNKYDDDLRALPRVNAAHNAVGESGYVEGTRIGILNELHDWAERTGIEALHKFFILIGAAGTGKSTIAREVCRQLQEEGRLGASFFFVRSDAGALGSVQNVYPTIAFQLASLHRRFRRHIAEAAREFMKLPSGLLKEQMELLILNPLKKVENGCPDQLANPIVIVIDALDEANGDLATFLESLKDLVNREPRLRVFITTRPESPIMYAVKSTGIDSMCKQTFMSDIPQTEADSDIKLFLEIHFQKLRFRDILLAKHPDAIIRLTEKAERLFIYARTVVRYLDCKAWEISVQRLAAILSGDVSISGMYTLDVLYMTILKDAYDDMAMENVVLRERVVAVLAGLVVLQEQVTITILAPLMGVEEDAAVRTVEELRSIISCSGSDLKKDIIQPLHLSLREFLVDRARCTVEEFYIDRRVYHARALKSCLRIMNKGLRRDMCQLGDAFKIEINDLESRIQAHIPPHVRYACVYWTAHLVENGPTIDTDTQILLEQFCKRKMLQWIEVLSLINRLDSAVHALLRAYSWANVFTGLATILEDAYRFVARFYDPINESPGQTYTSALSFTPECSLVELYADEERSCIMVTPRNRSWGACLNVVNGWNERALFSREGNFLLSWLDVTIVIRDATTGNPQKAVRRENRIVSVDIHPDSRSVVSLLEDGTVEEWYWTPQIHLVRTYACSEADENESRSWHGQVKYSGDGSRIVCHWGNVDAIYLWSTGDQPQDSNRISLHGKKCEAFSLDAEGVHMSALLIFDSASAIVKRWNVDTGEETSFLQVEMDDVQRATFAENNNMLVTGHEWRKICVWNLKDGSCSLSMTIHEDWQAFDVAPSGDVIASGRDEIYFWNARSGELLGVYRGHSDIVRSLQFSPREDRLVSTSSDDSIRIWDIRQEALSQSISDDTRYLDNITFSPDGGYIAANVSEDILVFDGSNGSLLAKFVGHTLPVGSLAFCPTGSLLATYNEDDGVFIWDIDRKLTSPKSLSQSKGNDYYPAITFNANATLIAIISSQNDTFTITVWNIADYPDERSTETGNKVFQSNSIRGFSPHYIRFAPSMHLSFSRHRYPSESEIIIWDLTRDVVETCAYEENVHFALDCAFDIEGNWVTSTKSGRRLLWLPEDRIAHNTSRFAVNGRMIAVASKGGVFTVLDMSRLSNL